MSAFVGKADIAYEHANYLDRSDNGRIDSARFEPEEVFHRCGYLVDRQEGRDVVPTLKSRRS
jgi:hypothetical protein